MSKNTSIYTGHTRLFEDRFRHLGAELLFITAKHRDLAKVRARSLFENFILVLKHQPRKDVEQVTIEFDYTLDWVALRNKIYYIHRMYEKATTHLKRLYYLKRFKDLVNSLTDSNFPFVKEMTVAVHL